MRMNMRYPFPAQSFCPSVSVPLPPNPPSNSEAPPVSSVRHSRVSSFLIRAAMRISRARWFTFLRRVFHYQNGSRSDLGSNPFNTWTWMVLELIALLIQLTLSGFTLSASKTEKPVWPMRIWILGYDIGCALSLLLLYGRYTQLYQASPLPDLEQQQRHTQESRTSLELFFAIWFVMGNVWIFDSRLGTMNRAPKLNVLCVSLLTWNALCYSFPFLLFLLLCCCVPLISSVLGYNMNMGSIDKAASDDQISSLPSWKYKAVSMVDDKESSLSPESEECCICISKYKDKEEVRELPCLHKFHLKCVDQWLRIISCCPLCKQELKR
ncbi:E3 ubiquitin-protein ligase At4g11680 [Linum grandiflorum]